MPKTSKAGKRLAIRKKACLEDRKRQKKNEERQKKLDERIDRLLKSLLEDCRARKQRKTPRRRKGE